MRLVVACKRLKTVENHRQAQKLVAVAYRGWSFTRGSNCKALTGKILMFLDFDVMEVRLFSH